MSNQNMIIITACPICNSADLQPMGTRSDGIAVLQCTQCQMGFVERYPANLNTYYEGDYYAAETGLGYVDYDVDAAHSLSWVIYLIHISRSTGRVLDIGCANGYLLKRLGEDFSLYGIEVNESMVRECQSAGITVVSQDINDQKLSANYVSSFDVITGIAVLEHVADMRAALRQIKSLLASDGLFIFEVPLISDTHDNTNWYTTSLEHIYYPTVAGLRSLFQEEFGLPLIGGEVVIGQVCSTFVGLVSINKQVHTELAKLHAKLFEGPISDLRSQQEKTFRFLFDVIHAATTKPESVALLPHIDASVLDTRVRERMSALWLSDMYEHGSYWKSEAARLTELLRQQQTWTDELERGKTWLEQQYVQQQAEVERLHALLSEQRQHIEEQQHWIAELEQAKTWLDEQRANWQAEAERLTAVVAEQQQWIAELEQAKAWHEQQTAHWQAQLEKIPGPLRKLLNNSSEAKK